MNSKRDYRQLIKDAVTPIQDLELQELDQFRWLSESIQYGKAPLKSNTVDFIIIKVLNKRGNVFNFHKKQSFDVYVIGSFRKYFTPTLRVAEAFAEFYLEMAILPNIISVPKHRFLRDLNRYQKKIENGILVYERG